MDKYEYNVKLDEIKALVGKQDYAGAAGICDTIEWRKVRINNTLNMVADVYEATKQYDKAKHALLIAYERTPLGRQLAYRLTILSIKEKNFEEAQEFYEDFLEVSPRDMAKYLLQYQMAKARGTDIDVLIAILEKYSEEDVDERWQYELALLYHRAGYRDKCIALCDEMILWFGDGKYVEKALELKMLYEPLTKSQQEKYNKQKEERAQRKAQVQKEAQVQREVQAQRETQVQRKVQVQRETQVGMQTAPLGSISQQPQPETIQEEEVQTDYMQKEQPSILEGSARKTADREYRLNDNGSIVSKASGSGDVSDVVPAEMLREKLEEQKREEEKKEEEKRQEVKRVVAQRMALAEQEVATKEKVDFKETIPETSGNLIKAEESADENPELNQVTEKSEIESETQPEMPLKEESVQTIEEPASEVHIEEPEMEMPLKEEAVQEAEEPASEIHIEEPEMEMPLKEEPLQTAEEPVSEVTKEEQDKEAIQEKPETEEMTKEEEMLNGSTGELVENLGHKIRANAIQEEYNRVNLQEEIAKSMASILGNLQLSHEEEEEEEEPEITTTKRIPDMKEDVMGDTQRVVDISQIKEKLQPMNAMSEQPPEDEQIEGQLSLEDVMAQFEKEPQGEEKEGKEGETISYFTRPVFGEEFTAGIKEALGEDVPLQEEAVQNMEESEDLSEQSQHMVTEDMVTDEYLEQMDPTEEIVEEEYQAPVFNVQSFRDMEKPEVPQEEAQPQQEEIQVQLSAAESAAAYEPAEDITKVDNGNKEEQQPLEYAQEKEEITEPVPKEEQQQEEQPQEYNSQQNLLQTAENAFENWYDKTKLPTAVEEPKQTQQPQNEKETHYTDPALEKMRKKKEEKKNNNKGKKRIPESKRSAFSSFLEIKDLEEQIALTLENLSYHSSNDGTSSTNNVMIAGEAKSGKTTLALELIKTSNKDRSRTGRKVAKVKGTTLNKRGIKNVMAKLLGTDLIIEQAGSLMPQQVSELMDTLNGYTGNMLVVLEDDKVAIERLVELHPKLEIMFSNQIVIKEYDINEWVRIAKEYAQSQDYGVDEVGTLALYAKINDVYGKKKEIEKSDVQKIIDDAIKHSEKKNINKLFEIVFSRKYKDSDLTMLREQDFQ